MTESIIRAHAVEKYYLQPDGSRIEVIAPVDLDVEPGKIITLLGPSGCGKSTLLRILTGLSKPSSGEVLWHGKPITSQNAGVAIVFQSFALFPWLTVLDNVEAPLEARGVAAMERHKRALRILDTVGLDGFESAYPKELSGGMKQRVGFARALVVEPEVLFMDEPFSALDVLTAENLRGELLELWLSKKMPTKAIFIVTHNIEEAVLLADRVIVLARNPAWVRADFAVELAHPRDRKSPRFIELVDYIYKIMTQPQLALPVPDANPSAQKPARQKYQMIPHARVGGIAGLLELLQDRGGKEYLHRLAEVLIMDAEDLLPIVEAAALLNFAKSDRGDIEITPQGNAFAQADIDARKKLFRDASLAHVNLIRQMYSALSSKSDHTLPLEFFQDLLREYFSENEVKRQIETALNWGRYGEVFTYDADTDRLILYKPAAANDGGIGSEEP